MDMDVLYDLSTVLENDSCRKELVVTLTWTEVNDGQEKQCKKIVKDIKKAHLVIKKLLSAQSDSIKDVQFNVNFTAEGSIDLESIVTSAGICYNRAEMDDKELAKQVAFHAVLNHGVNMSIVQRRFFVGYARAARTIDRLVDIGVIKRRETNSPMTQYDIAVSKDKLVEIIDNNF